MNSVVAPRRARLLRALAVYGILPFFSFLLAVLVVLMQFVNSRLVFPEESLPLYRSLALAHAAQNLKQESAPAPKEVALLAGEDFPTTMLAALPEVPPGVFPIVRTTISMGSGLINATDYSADLSVAASTAPLAPSADGPRVLVVHTHATESFFEPETSPVQCIVTGQSPEVFGYYEEGLSPRSRDCEKNMVAVGRVFCRRLESVGIETVHCETLHDLDYSQAYANSLASIERYLEEYPSIRYVLDLHRDSLVRADGTKLKPTCTIDGEEVAQVMLVVGAGSQDLAQPSWKQNLAFCARFQSCLQEIAPDFARPVYLRYGRFNQHLGERTMLLEVGSCGNTLQEASRSAEYAADAFAELYFQLEQAP